MKKLITIIFICLCVQSFAQTEWAPIGAKWYFDKQEMLPFNAHGYIQYEVKKDTIIDLKTVKLIRKQEIRFDGFLLETDTLYAYKENEKIYYLSNENS
jgi:hypothetical protein